MELFSTKKREIQRFFIFFVPISIRSIHFLFRSMFLENSYLIPNRILHHKELNSRKTLQYSKSVSMHLFRCLKHHYGVSFGLSCRENKRISPKKKRLASENGVDLGLSIWQSEWMEKKFQNNSFEFCFFSF